MNLSLQLHKNKEYDNSYVSQSLKHYPNESLNPFDPLLMDDSDRELINSVKDLQEIQKNLASLVDNQKEKIDTIQNNISETEQKTKEAIIDLHEADKLFFSYKPIFIGGTVGVLTGGPIGLIVGMKWTGLSTGIGGLLGGYIGYKAQKD
jgi:hypothetical protein